MAADIGLTLDNLGIELPHSVQAEQSVLGAVLLDPSGFSLVISRLRQEMFYVRQNQAVFAEMMLLMTNSMPLDVVVLADKLSANEAFSQPGSARQYLAEIASTVPSLSNLVNYIDIVEEKYIKRQLMQLSQETLQQASEDLESKVMLEAAEQRLYEIRTGKQAQNVQLLRDAIISVMSHLQLLDGPDKDQYLGIPTGFSYLDKVLTGLGKGDLIILASRPGMGKTSFSLNIAQNIAKKDISVLFFSLEMSKEQLAGRLLSAATEIDSRQFRTGIENPSSWEKLAMASETMGTLPIYLDDTANITIAEMKSKMRQINQDAVKSGKKRVGLVVIDYLQLMSSGRRNENRVQEISEITRSLKVMAKDLGLPVLVMSQLSRSTEKGRADHRPQLSDLRDSGSIEQDADVVMFLYREAYYNDNPEANDVAQCIVAKNRHGETASVNLVWDGAHTRYRDWSPERDGPIY